MNKRLIDIMKSAPYTVNGEKSENGAQAKAKAVEKVSHKEIAIIGIAAKLPLADDVHAFWRNLNNGIDCVRPYPDNRRRDMEPCLPSLRINPDTAQFAEGGYLDRIDAFDYSFFRLSPKEASFMDPNQRLFLETAWSAVEDAGYGGDTLRGSRTGVYVGFRADDYFDYKNVILSLHPSEVTTSFVGNMTSIIAGRLSYMQNWRGPSMAIDTSCSSSLVAVHMACQAIRYKECDLALAGGVRIDMLPLVAKEKLGAASSTGRARTFDHSSDGTGMGEGVAAVLLKPLHKALKDGDHVYAVVKGSAINQDGSSVGMTAPNVEAQEEVIVRAWKDADIDPETISYIEAHGTGTKLGDPIEIDGIRRAFARYTDKKQFCAIGAVKTNIGHLDNAAGLAGLIKAVMALKHKTIPPMLHFQRPNAAIDFVDSPVYVNHMQKQWETDGSPRRCGISSFGFSGTNCHVILEEAPDSEERQEITQDVHYDVLALSALTREALEELAAEFRAHLASAGDSMDIRDVCYTANVGRGHYPYRMAFVVKDREDLIMQLERAVVPDKSAKDEEAAELKQFKQLAESIIQDVRAEEGGASVKRLLEKLCGLYVRGASIDWRRLYDGDRRKRVSLPVYPFQRKRCWPDVPACEQSSTDEGLFYETVWQPAELLPGERSAHAKVVVLRREGTLEAAIADRLRQQGKQVIEAAIGSEFAKIDDTRYTIRNCAEDYTRLFSELKGSGWTQVVHLLALAEQSEAEEPEQFTEQLEDSVYGLLYLLQAVVRESGQAAVEVAVVAKYANAVTNGQERVNPHHAAMFGLVKCMMWEQPNISCRLLDVDDRTSNDRIAAELDAKQGDYATAYRNNCKYVEVLRRADRSAVTAAKNVLRADGVYLITGGLGDIGLKIAAYLSSCQRVKLALLSRSALPARSEWARVLAGDAATPVSGKIKAILDIEAAGSVVMHLQADVSSKAEMEAAAAELRAQFGTINGVIHCAGVGEKEQLADLGKESLTRVLLPKVHGSWVLDRVTRTDELDFFFVFSSVVTLLGGGGGGAYTAANSYLDAFAAHRNRKGRTTHAVNWPIWENTGATKAYTVNRERDLFHVLKPETAVAAFGTLLGQKEERTVVGQFNDDGIIMELANYLPFRFAPELHVKQAWSGRANAESSRKRQGVRLTGNGRNEYTATETRVAEIWHEVLGEEELDVHQSFFDIGGDSILLARLQTLIEDAYPNTVSISDLFAFPSIGKLSQYIDSQMLSVEPADLAAQKDEKQGMRENEDKGIERTIDELLADIETGRLTVDKAVQSYRAAGDK